MHSRADIKWHTGSYALLSDQSPETAIVFVHGFWGDSVTTWLQFQSEIDSEKNENAFAQCDLYFYDYASTSNELDRSARALGDFVDEVVASVSAERFRLWLPPTRASTMRAAGVTFLDTLNRRYDKIVFVGHSLGGVVIRQLLLSVADGTRKEWTSSGDRLTATSPVLFAPAIFGFKHDVIVAMIKTKNLFLEIAVALWQLTKGKVYREVLAESTELGQLEHHTEYLYGKAQQPAGLRAFIYWGEDENIVIRGKYVQDTRHDPTAPRPQQHLQAEGRVRETD